MKLKKLAVLAGTMMMLTAFSMNAYAALYVDTQNQQLTINETQDASMWINAGITYTIANAGSFSTKTRGASGDIYLDDGATLIVEGQLNVDDAGITLSRNSTIKVQNGGKITGNPHSVSASEGAKVIVDNLTNGSLEVTNAPAELSKIVTYTGTSAKDSGSSESTPAAPVAKKAMDVTLKKTTVTANGSKAVKAGIKAVKVDGKRIASKYYKVTYKNNRKAGKAQVIVTGKGKYKALRATAEYVIKPAKAKLTKTKAAKNALTLSWKKQSGVAGYEVQYSTNRKFTDAVSVYPSIAVTKKTIENLTSKKKYYVRIRAGIVVDNAELVFGKWSSVKAVKVK